ncbi:aldehyde oxidoreductase molybdenum-binding subunit PaoC [Pseudomonas sp. Marseille-Q0931]|uniref:aldehyde oxidoreductase molybdenum-binding subunit PaoC n=1 Tax=Pseudomonas sp. Marseille-Q0931 TaxID=2697507 RepID=UPI0023B93BBF|nr:aldehyde oxidoreductase molybdenum-binding subunit PaoC [Pseudomonas sp. Marseille-Q0931]
MKFETAEGANPIDRQRVVGQPLDRIDGPLKTTGTATYAYEWHAEVADLAYGQIVGAAIAKGRIVSMDLSQARAAPGVITIVTADTAPDLNKGERNNATLLGGPEIEHYHQAVALVVAESFEQARAAAELVKIDYQRQPGNFDLEAAKDTAKKPEKVAGSEPDTAVGDFDSAFASAPVQLDATYHTPDQSHAMMEPHASMARWDDDRLTLWTSNQMIAWGAKDLAETLGIDVDKVRLISPYVGGGFGGKLFIRADALMAALGARAAGRPVKVALPRPLMMNNTTHRAATIQRIRIGARRDGQIVAIGHDNWSGDLNANTAESGVIYSRPLYAGANRMSSSRLAALDMPEANAMRAPSDTPGSMAVEIAMDEMAEKLGLDPVDFRVMNDSLVDPEKPERSYSQRHLKECLLQGAQRFGWAEREAKPATRREGDWLIGLGMAGAFRDGPVTQSAARVRLDAQGRLTVETDMTDIGTGSYTIIGQTAAEMLGVTLDQVSVKLGDSSFPVSSGSGGQWGANSSTAGVYAACVKLREQIARKLGFDPARAVFDNGEVRHDDKRATLAEAAAGGTLEAEDGIEFGDLDKRYRISTFGAHFVEVAVHAATAEVRVRRMLAVCSAGRILNPKTARSQVIGAMTMGVGAALMEELSVDTRYGLYINHDLAGYEVPVHADIPHQEVVFLDESDALSSPMKAKGVGELGICGVSAAVANAIYNATGVRVRDYPVTLDKLLAQMPVA